MGHRNIHAFVAALLAGLFLIAPRSASACRAFERESAPLMQFIVSAVLRKPGRSSVIRLVHGRTAAASAGEATKEVLMRVKKDFAGYSVVTTLASELDAPAPACPPRSDLEANASATARAARAGA